MNSGHVVGGLRLLLAKKSALYQKPGFTFPVYAPPQTLPLSVRGSRAPGWYVDALSVPVRSVTQFFEAYCLMVALGMKIRSAGDCPAWKLMGNVGVRSS